MGTEGERTVRRGGHAGDRAVRIVRPRLPGLRSTAPGYVLVEQEPEAKGAFERQLRRLRRLLIGAPIPSEQRAARAPLRAQGLAVFGSDNISSSAYASEEIMRVLALAGVAALALTLPLTLAIVALLVIVVTSYQQTIQAYPKGGGSYIVASENLGTVPGLVAGGVDPGRVRADGGRLRQRRRGRPHLRLPRPVREPGLFAVAAVAVIAWGNLRGVRESGTLFAAPVYLYLGSILGLLASASSASSPGRPPPTSHPRTTRLHAHGVQALGLFLVLRAFASGAVGLTGTEAIADGVGAFKPPEARNARIVLLIMATCFVTVFVGISFLASWLHIVPDPAEAETVNSQLTRTLVGIGPYYYLVQFATALLLVLRRTPPSPTSPAWPSSWPGTSSSPATSPSAASAWPSPTGSPSWPPWPPC